MKIREAYEVLIREYLSKCREQGCDSCMANTYCTINKLRLSRYPQRYCKENLKKYLRDRDRSE